MAAPPCPASSGPRRATDVPRKTSSITALPAPVLKEVNRLLASGKWTLAQIVEYLAEAGHPVSKSSVHRHQQKLDKVAAKLRRSREMADALVAEIGPAATEGKTGRLLVEILQRIAFDFMMKRLESEDGEDAEGGDGGGEDLGAQEFMFLGRALKDLASAQKIDVDRELKIRRDVVRKAGVAVDKVARKRGLTKGAVDELKAEFLGLA